MKRNIRKRLVDLGVEELADALVELAGKNKDVESRVDRMTATPEEIVKRFRSRIAGLKRRRTLIFGREVSALARKLASMLEDLEAGVQHPKKGVELVASFYRTDRGVLGHCDDSYGNVGDVYRFDAKDLFVHYASRCEEKEWLASLVLELNEEDDFGIRDSLIHCAGEYLPEETMRSMVEELWAKWERERTDEDRSKRPLWMIESLARQLKDGPLFEKVCRVSRPEGNTAAALDIAKVYFASGNAFAALSWLNRIPDDDSFTAHDRERLLLAVHKEMGNKEQLAKTAWRIFRSYRSEETLETLLDAIGEKKREKVLKDEAVRILRVKEISYSDAGFLVEMGMWDEAENYILGRVDQLEGEFYSSLLPLAEAFESEGRSVAASVLYRALLESILERGISKYYGHGVRYLKKLDTLAEKIRKWGTIAPHLVYADAIRKEHGRKNAFWSRYEK